MGLRRLFVWVVVSVAVLGFVSHFARPRVVSAQTAPRYLFAWAGDEDRADSDFLAVIDLQTDGGRYGTIVATTPVGEKGLWPHHTEYELGPGKTLFANGFPANRNFLFDLHNPLKPEIITRFGSVGGLSFLHSFARLPGGHVLATFQGHGDGNERPGGLAEMDEKGRLAKSGSSADATADPSTLRPYSLAVVPSLDRAVVALTAMSMPSWHSARASIEHDHSGNQVQVWRLSDLSLIKTIKLPGPDAPNEPRVLQDGRTVLVNTGACRLYRVAGLDGADPQVQLVHDATTPGCATPVVVGKYWIQANAPDRRVFVLDVSDLTNVRQVSSVSFDDRQRPHWLATDGTRVVMTNEPRPEADRRMWMLRLDRSTGQLSVDSSFRDAGSDRPGVAFDRPSWPHGATGTAVPHGTVFGW
jgi:hypothetical protein